MCLIGKYFPPHKKKQTVCILEGWNDRDYRFQNLQTINRDRYLNLDINKKRHKYHTDIYEKYHQTDMRKSYKQRHYIHIEKSDLYQI